MQSEKLAVLQSVSHAYERDGFAKIKGVFDQKIVDMIRMNAYDLLQKTAPGSSCVQKLPNGRPALYFWPSHHNAFMKSIYRCNVMKDIVGFFLGPNVVQLNNQIYYREAGDGDQFAWHQDLTFRTPKVHFDAIETGYLQTVIVVDPVRRDNGAVEFIPGSHKLGDLNLVPRDNTEKGLRKFDRGIWEGVKLEADPGDVLIWNVMTVHGSEENRSKHNRMVYMNGFAKAECIKTGAEYPYYLKGGQ